MCPQLDMSDKNKQKTQDMSDKARCVRQKLITNRKICPTDLSDKNENKMKDMSDRVQLAFKPTLNCATYASNYMSLQATCMHVLDVCAWLFRFFRKTPTKHIISVGHILRFSIISVGHI